MGFYLSKTEELALPQAPLPCAPKRAAKFAAWHSVHPSWDPSGPTIKSICETQEKAETGPP